MAVLRTMEKVPRKARHDVSPAGRHDVSAEADMMYAPRIRLAEASRGGRYLRPNDGVGASFEGILRVRLRFPQDDG